MSSFKNREIFEQVVTFLRQSSVYSRRLPENLDRNFDLIESEILDSVGILHFVVFLEETFNIEVISTELSEENFSNLQRIEHYIARKVNGTVNEN